VTVEGADDTRDGGPSVAQGLPEILIGSAIEISDAQPPLVVGLGRTNPGRPDERTLNLQTKQSRRKSADLTTDRLNPNRTPL
jgi:hypothetical protein